MNYASLTYDELARMATTDKGAREYITEHAQDFMEDVDEIDYESVQGLMEDSLQAGKDEGWDECRKHLRETFDKELEWALERIEKQGEITGNAKRLHDLLQSIRCTIQ